MTDEKLRALERTFKESGSPEDELAWLRERVRQGEGLDWDSYSRLAESGVEAASEYLLARVERGELEREKLELAAYCSHEPARLALALLGAGVPEAPEDLEQWVEGLTRWGKSAVVRAGISAARAVQRYWERSFPQDVIAEEAIAASLAWLDCPCAEHAHLAEAAGRRADSVDAKWSADVPQQALEAVTAAAEVALAVGEDAPNSDTENAAWHVSAGLLCAAECVLPRVVRLTTQNDLVQAAFSRSLSSSGGALLRKPAQSS